MPEFNPTPTRYAQHLKRWTRDDNKNKKVVLYLPGEEALKLLSEIDEARKRIVSISKRRVRLSRSDFIRQALRFALDNMTYYYDAE